MKRYVGIDPTGRIYATSPGFRISPESEETFDFPENFDFDKQGDYRLENGALLYDPLLVENLVLSQTEEQTAALCELAGLVDTALNCIDEQDAALCELAALVTANETTGGEA